LARAEDFSASQSRGDELLSRLLHGEAGKGTLEYCLLLEVGQGYPVERIRPLLTSHDEEIVAAGIWIASELSHYAKPLLPEIVGLIRHPFFKVRFFVFDCLLNCATPRDGHAIALAVDLIDDSHSGVRWQALVFLATVREELLRAIPKATTIDAQTALHQKGLRMLLAATTASNAAETVTSAISSPDSLLRRYGAAAAARMVYRDPGPLKKAMESADSTISEFARDMMARASIVPPSHRR
jgi:hypothetical protein